MAERDEARRQDQDRHRQEERERERDRQRQEDQARRIREGPDRDVRRPDGRGY